MIYKMKKERYNFLNMKHEELIDYLNDEMRFMNIKQKSIVVEDFLTGERQIINFSAIGLSPMKVITNVVTY